MFSSSIVVIILMIITRAHSFPREELTNSAVHLVNSAVNLVNSAVNLVNSAVNLVNSAAHRGKADEIPRLTAVKFPRLD